MSVVAILLMVSLGVCLAGALCTLICGIWDYPKATVIFTILYFCAGIVAGLLGTYLVIRFIEAGIMFFLAAAA